MNKLRIKVPIRKVDGEPAEVSVARGIIRGFHDYEMASLGYHVIPGPSVNERWSVQAGRQAYLDIIGEIGGDPRPGAWIRRR